MDFKAVALNKRYACPKAQSEMKKASNEIDLLVSCQRSNKLAVVFALAVHSLGVRYIIKVHIFRLMLLNLDHWTLKNTRS